MIGARAAPCVASGCTQSADRDHPRDRIHPGGDFGGESNEVASILVWVLLCRGDGSAGGQELRNDRTHHLGDEVMGLPREDAESSVGKAVGKCLRRLGDAGRAVGSGDHES